MYYQKEAYRSKKDCFGGGYFDGSGNPHYYVTDWQGNNIGVVDRNRLLEQRTDYCPYGEPWVEPEATASVSAGGNRFLFGDKERTRSGGLNECRFPARDYVPGFPRFATIDPMCEGTPWLSPYAYCAGNPVMYIDPTGYKPSNIEAACMAAHIYGDKEDDILIGGWEKTKDNLGLELNNSNGLKSAIYARKDKDGNVLEYAYVMAGTQPEFDDIAADVLQVFGLSGQYDNALENSKYILRNINKGLTYIGHSMGGAEAALNSIVTGEDAITFNAAGLSPATLIRYGVFAEPQSKIDAYIMRTDPLNILQDACRFKPTIGLYPANGNRKYLTPTDFGSAVNGHAIDSILKSFGINPNNFKIIK